MSQKIEYIKIKDLVLWTENPRDPINPNAKDQDIVNKALDDTYSKWTLEKLAKDMGDYYDFSELPTVVYHGKKPIVYDGNRRVILGKIKLGDVKIERHENLNIPDFPIEIPCNVCDKDTALNNVLRKHSDSGSWQPLERDIFLHKFMKQPKTPFLILQESTKLITTNPHLNQRFVKEEIFKEEILNSMGFFVDNGELKSFHNNEDARNILIDISKKVGDKIITTRKNRGKVLEILEPYSQQLIDQNKNKKPHLARIDFDLPEKALKKRLTKRTPYKAHEFFGGKLYLKMGDVSNLYRDIVDLYDFYIKHKSDLSDSFPSLIRMSLRLICETAAKDSEIKLDTYLKLHFTAAKENLDQDIKTTLFTLNINESSLVNLLHIGAHAYKAANNMEQTIAISIIVGSILTNSHGK